MNKRIFKSNLEYTAMMARKFVDEPVCSEDMEDVLANLDKLVEDFEKLTEEDL